MSTSAGAPAKRTRFDPLWLVIALLTVFFLAPLARAGFFVTAHDARHNVYFLMQFDQAFREGYLYPGWAPDMVYGYGYPLWVVVYAPLAFYLGEFFHLLGAGFPDAVKAVYAVGAVLSGWTMYLLARDFLPRGAAALAAVAYLYIPYHLSEVYVRGALAEYLAMAFAPLVLWAFRRLVERGGSGYFAAAALSYAALMYSHFVMALLFTALVGAYVVYLLARWAVRHPGEGRAVALRVLTCLGAGVAGLGASAAFWLPVAQGQQYIKSAELVAEQYGYANHFVYLFQLFSPYWGYGYSHPGPADEMPFQLGAAALVLGFFGLWRFFAVHQEDWGERLFFGGVTVVAVLLMLAPSRFVWDALPPIAFVQFPWRLLTITTLSLAVVAGAALGPMLDREQRALALGALALPLILASYPYLAPRNEPFDPTLATLMRFEVEFKELLGSTAWVTEKPDGSPLVAQYLDSGGPMLKAVVETPGAGVEQMSHGAHHDTFRVSAPAGVTLLVYTRYFPGWHGYVDGAPVEVRPHAPDGLMELDVPPGEHTVLLRFEDQPVQIAGRLLSALTVLWLLGWWAWGRWGGRPRIRG